MKFGVKASTSQPVRWVEEAQRVPPGFDSFTLDCSYPLPEISATVVKALRSVQAERGLAYFVHTPVVKIALGSADAHVRRTSIREVKRALDLATQVGSKLITVHPTPCPDSERANCTQMERLQQEALVELCTFASARGVVVAIENMPPGKIFAPAYSDLSGLFALLAEIDGLAITLDVGHANMAGMSPRDVVSQLGKRLQHVHIHDNDGSADQHLPVGRGTVDWPGLIQALIQIGYTGVMEFEFQGRSDLLASTRYLESLR